MAAALFRMGLADAICMQSRSSSASNGNAPTCWKRPLKISGYSESDGEALPLHTEFARPSTANSVTFCRAIEDLQFFLRSTGKSKAGACGP